MTKIFKTLSVLFVGVLMVLALGTNTSKAETFNDLTVKGDARFQYPIYADGGLIQFGGGDLRMLDFNQGSSRIYNQGDLYVVTDDNLYFNFSNQSSDAMATFDSRVTVNNNFNALFPIYAQGNEIVFNGSGVAVKTADSTPRIYRSSDALRMMAPNMYLDVPGTVTVENNFVINGDLQVVGAQTYTGNTTFSGTVTATELASLNGGIAVDTNKFTVADTSGNTVIGGTLDVTGATTLQGTLTTGNISAYGSGDNANLTINAKGTGTIGIGNVSSGAVAITPATTITGATTLSSTLDVTGATTLSSTLGVGGNITYTAGDRALAVAQAAEDVAGGSLSIGAGNAGTTTGAGLAGGDLYMYAGSPSTGGNAGDVWIYTDHGGSLVNGGSTHGGDVYLSTGNGVGAAGNAGDIIIQPGNGAGTGSAGALLFANDKNQTIRVDQANADTAGKALSIVSGVAGAPTAGAGLNGGNITISSGDGSAAVSGDTDGGDGGHVVINPGSGGAGSGTGESGDAGDIYLDSGEYIVFGGTSSALGNMKYDMLDANWHRYVENPAGVAISAYAAVVYIVSGEAGYANNKRTAQVATLASDGESHRFAGIAGDDGIDAGGNEWIIVYGNAGEGDGADVDGPLDGDSDAVAGNGFVLDGTAGAIRKTVAATDESCGFFVQKDTDSHKWIVFVRGM